MSGRTVQTAGIRGAFPLNGSVRSGCLLGAEPMDVPACRWAVTQDAQHAMLHGAPRWSDARLAVVAAERGHAAALLNGYRRDGVGVLEHLFGDFAAVVVDERDAALLLATDRLGIRQLFHAESSGMLVFGERADVVAAHQAIRAGISHQGFYNYLYFHVVPGPGTIFESVMRLMPGEAIHVQRGRVQHLRYWEPRYDASSAAEGEQRLKARFRELVRNAVHDAANYSPGRIGAFLSGGTDSSTIAGVLAQLHDEKVRTYSIGFDAPGYDEMTYARTASRHFGTAHHEYYVTPGDVTEAVPQIAASTDQPFGNASVVPAYYCARMARSDGVDCMLAGDGGDELFGGNYRYAKQQMFESYLRLPSLLRSAVVEPVLLGLPGTGAFPGLRKLRSYVAQARVPMPQRMESYNLLERLGAQNILSDEWLSRADPQQPKQWLYDCYNEVAATSMVDRMLAVDMRFTLADSDLPKVNSACGLAGVSVRYPWLDDRLVAFAATLPSRHKVRGRQLRYLFKEALRGFLPDEIIAKRKQGFGLPFGIWLRDHDGLRSLAGDSLHALVNRGIIRAAAVDELLGGRHQDHAAYFGTFIWILMMFEQWLARRDPEGAWT